LLVFGIAFVLALNLAVRLDQPHLTDAYRLVGVDENVQWQVVRSGPGQALSVEPRVTPNYLFERAEEQLYSQNLNRLRTWSLLAVVGLACASWLGGFVLSGMMLRPVRDITEVASEISETNLSRRINHQGPDDELKALADTFDSMIGRLEGSFERQRQFVQDASHELRTPLAAIRMNIEVTEMDPDVTADEYRELLETVKTQTARLTRLSEDLLLLTTSERDRPPVEPVDVAALAREVVSQLEPLAAAREVTLRAAGLAGVEAKANPNMLYRCVSNLVDNGIKYSGEGALVEVSTNREGGTVVIAVRDTGPGIAPEDAAHVFDRFYRVDKGRSRREGGTGLGLAIVREMVTEMGGTVRLASEAGRGSTFSIRLPASLDVPAAAGQLEWAPA
jgi:signal transduction histidine kinase